MKYLTQAWYGLILALCLITCQVESAHYNDFETNPFLNHDMREAFRPYILPQHHPLKAKLDALFLTQRVIQDETTFRKAGFKTLFHNMGSFIRVASHRKMPGYLFKVYLDSELRKKMHKPGWVWLTRRCEGAAKIRKVIKSKHVQFFDVAKKWLYPLPKVPSPPKTHEYERQPVILIVEDMKLVNREDNLEAWRTKITKSHLDELYVIIKKAKGSSYRPDNIWYNIHGKFCFIDTEYPKYGPDFQSITKYLNPEMQKYWKELIN